MPEQKPMTAEQKLAAIRGLLNKNWDNKVTKKSVGLYNTIWHDDVFKILNAPPAKPQGEIVTVCSPTKSQSLDDCIKILRSVDANHEFKSKHGFDLEPGESRKALLTLTMLPGEGEKPEKIHMRGDKKGVCPRCNSTGYLLDFKASKIDDKWICKPCRRKEKLEGSGEDEKE